LRLSGIRSRADVGIATFTTNLQQAISTSCANLETAIVAMTDHGHAYDYPSIVRFQVNDDRIEDTRAPPSFLNAASSRAVCLQHEFGIFGGEAALISWRCSPG